MDYQGYDTGIRHYPEKLEIAKSLGYDSVLEAYGKMFKSNMLPSEIAEIFDVTKNNIRFHLKKLGIKQNSPGGRNFAKLDERKVRVILRGKKDSQYYARKYGVSLTTINDIRKRRTWKEVSV